MKNVRIKIQTCAQLLALCALLSCAGGGEKVPPPAADAGDSLTVSGTASREFLETEDRSSGRRSPLGMTGVLPSACRCSARSCAWWALRERPMAA